MRIDNRTRGTVLADRAMRAQGWRGRMVGLLDRSALQPGEALILMPCAGLHTFGMRFPIDILLVDRALRVLRILQTVRPGRIATLRVCPGAIELAAGTVRATGTVPGDQLIFSRD